MDFLKELFTEPLSFEAFQKAVQAKGIKLADLSTGKYADMDKLTKANREVQDSRETIQTLTSELQTLREKNASAEEWKTKFEDLTTQMQQKEEAAKAEAAEKALTDSIISVFGDKKFTSDYVRSGLIADMKAEIAKPENQSKSYGEIFEALTKDKEGIFANPNPPVIIPGMGGAGYVGGDLDKMDMADYIAARKKMKG